MHSLALICLTHFSPDTDVVLVFFTHLSAVTTRWRGGDTHFWILHWAKMTIIFFKKWSVFSQMKLVSWSEGTTANACLNSKTLPSVEAVLVPGQWTDLMETWRKCFLSRTGSKVEQNWDTVPEGFSCWRSCNSQTVLFFVQTHVVMNHILVSCWGPIRGTIIIPFPKAHCESNV